MQQHLWWASKLWMTALAAALAGCASDPVTVQSVQPAKTTVAASSSAPRVMLLPSLVQSCPPGPLKTTADPRDPLVAIEPEDALRPEALNAHVCWGGGLHRIEAVREDRDCMTLLLAGVDKQGYLSWSRKNSFFKACGAGPYDRQLLQPFTLVWLSGKVTGRAEFAGTPIPVIEIETLYRGSDCLEGDDSPQCVHSYLQPLKKPR